jgi:hypothetical protein
MQHCAVHIQVHLDGNSVNNIKSEGEDGTYIFAAKQIIWSSLDKE